MTSLVWTTWVVTFCCSVVFRFPASEAFFRMRCTASITSLCCARKALPRSVVHLMSSPRRLTTSGSAGEPLNGRIPILLLDGGGKRLALQVGVFGHPLLQLDDFERVRRGGKHLRQERIRIEGDRRHQRIELVIGNLRRRGRRVVAACGCGSGEETTLDGMRSAAHSAAVTRVPRLARFEVMGAFQGRALKAGPIQSSDICAGH